MAKPLSAPTISGPVCSLRPWRNADAPVLEAACGDPGILRFTTVPAIYTAESGREWIQRQHDRLTGGTAIVLAIVPGAHDQPVGMAGLFGLDSPQPTARLGYWLLQRARGRGLATAAVRMLAEWGARQFALEAIAIDVERGNQASARVAARLGARATSSRMVRAVDGAVELVRYELDRDAGHSP